MSVVLAALWVCGCGALAWWAPGLGDEAVIFLYSALFVPYTALLLRAWRDPDLQPTPRAFAALLVAALLGRLLMVGADPLLSDDLYRYVWDGRVWLAGVNPFAHAPASEALAPLRDAAIWPHINHPKIPTIYPPGAQALFITNAALGGGLTGLRLLFIALELGCALGVGWRLHRAGWTPRMLWLAAIMALLNPLVVVETAWSGHLDAVAAWTLAGALTLFATTREGTTRGALVGAALGISVATKFLSLLALPLLLLAPTTLTRRRALIERTILTTTFITTVALSYAPVADVGPKRLFAGFGTYAAVWRSNDGPARLARALTRRTARALAPPDALADPADAGPDARVYVRLSGLDPLFLRMGWTKTWQGKRIANTTLASDQLASLASKLAAALLLGWALLYGLLVLRDPTAATLLLLALLLTLAPTVHPWYIVWLIPLAALRRDPRPLAFSLAVLAAYAAWLSARQGGPWLVPWWLALLEYAVVLAAGLTPALLSQRLPSPGDPERGDSERPFWMRL